MMTLPRPRIMVLSSVFWYAQVINFLRKVYGKGKKSVLHLVLQ
jgi:hypothetical protein